MGLSWRNPYSNFVFCSLNMRLTRSILFLGNRLLQWWGQGEVKFHHLLLVVCKITWSVPVRCFLSVPCVMSSHPSQIFVSHYHNFNVHNPHYLSRWNLVGSLKGRGIDKSLKKFGFLLIISSLLMRLQINLYRKRLPGLSHSRGLHYDRLPTATTEQFSKCSSNYSVVFLSHFNSMWPSLLVYHSKLYRFGNASWYESFITCIPAQKLPISVCFIIL